MKYLVACLSCLVFCVEPVQLAVARGVATYTVGFAATGSATAHVAISFSPPPPPISGLTEGSATNEANLAIGRVTVEESGRFPQAQAVSVERLGDSAVKETDYTVVSGFASAMHMSMPHLIGGAMATGGETMRVEGVLADTTVTPAAIKDIEFTLTFDPSSASEGDGDFTFTATVTSDVAVDCSTVTCNSDNQVRFLVTFNNGSATSGNDWTAYYASFGVFLDDGGTSNTRSTTLEIVDDNVPEDDETIVVKAVNTNLGITLTEEFTITDDDGPAPTLPTSITLSVSPSSVAENAGTATSVTVTATVDGNGRFLQDQTLTATVGKSGDSAVKETDYTAVNTVTITIAADAASGTGTFTLTPMNDSIYEGSETISVEGSVAGSAVTVTPATITITDDDTQSTALVLTLDPNSVEEDVGTANVGVTVRLNADARPMPTPVTISVTDGTASSSDYSVSEPTVSLEIPTGMTEVTERVEIEIANDDVVEEDETVTLEASVTDTNLASDSKDFTIEDDDVASTALVLTLGPNSAKEDAGTVDVEVEVSLNGAPRRRSTLVTISITDGTASSADYSVSRSTFSLRIPAGMTEITERVEFDIANDNITEEDETVTITASTAGLTSDSEDFTIEDDDVTSTALVLTLDPNSVKEDAGTVDVEIEVSLNGGARPGSTPVTISITDGTASSADYSVSRSTFSLEIPAGMTEITGTVPISIANDNVTEEDETVVIEATATGTSLTGDSKNFTIEDDDVVSTALVLTIVPARLHENSGTSWVRFTAGLDGATRTMDTPVELRVTAGTAMENADYRTPVVPTSLMISSGETSLSDSLQMVITDNDTMEGNKTVVIEVSATGTNLDSAREELTIVDDESGVRVDTLMAEVNATGGYTITTPVRQNMGAPVTSVVLHYGDGMTFEMTPMEMSSEGSYTAELMAPAEGGILYYYVLATNEDGLTTKYPPEGRYQDISDYTGGSRLVLLDFEDEDAGDKSTVGHAIVYRGGEGAFAEDALVLDGMDDHAEILGSSLGASEEFALEIMFNADDFDAAVLDAGGTYLVSKPARCAACWEESTFSLLWERSAASGTLLAARFWNPEYGESGQVELEIPMPLVARQWYHAVLEVQRNGAGQRALLRLRDQSGMLHGEDVAVLPAHPAISTYPIFVGHIGDRGFFEGRIDDVGFYNYAHFGLSLAGSEDAWEVPEGYVLEQNYPNPFNPVTTIRYDLAKVGHVSLEVSDLLGRRVALLVDAVQEAGAQEVRFDARDLPSGMYLYRLRVEDFVSVKKMVLLK